MDERAALRMLAERLPDAGDDAAVVDGLVLTTDMLHASTDFPPGTTPYTVGWRAVGASLSDVAAMGAEAVAAVAVYAAPAFDADALGDFADGASAVCTAVDARYVGGDLDEHEELTVVSTALGRTDDPVRRGGASAGEVVCVTGTLGRTAAALRRFEAGDAAGGNDLFRFPPRVAAGRALAPHATAMTDVSDGLARSLHELAEAGDCGFAVESAAVPVDPAVGEIAADDAEALELATTVGEDFELLFTVAAGDLEAARETAPVAIAELGRVTEAGVTMDGEPLADRGYSHGDDAPDPA
ncbi:MAG: thiamine-phosphate kinase [Halobacteriales archaeon]